MKPDESIKDMYTRLTDIVNVVKGLGKKLPNEELVNKVIRFLPKSWEAKVIAIEETKAFYGRTNWLFGHS